MQMRFSDFIVTDVVIAHCLTMIIVFSLYFKGIERLGGCVCESVVCMWVNYLGFLSVWQLLLIFVLFVLFLAFSQGWSKLGFNS